MKRLWITLLIIAMAVVITIPAGAGDINCDDPLSKPYTPNHSSCNPDDPTTTTTATPTEPSGFAECVFDPFTGVLDSWHGQEGDVRQCVWHVDNPSKTFDFQIKSDLEDPVEEVKLPVLIVNDDIVFPSDKCFHDSSGKGFQDLPYPAASWEISPASAGCGDGPYLLTISVQALKTGKVNLVMTPLTG